jgi:hypothetical protein
MKTSPRRLLPAATTRRTRDEHGQYGPASHLRVPAGGCFSHAATAGEAAGAENAWRGHMGLAQRCACAGAEVSDVHCRLSRDRWWLGCFALHCRPSACGAGVAVLGHTGAADRSHGNAIQNAGGRRSTAGAPQRATEYASVSSAVPRSLAFSITYSVAWCGRRVYKSRARITGSGTFRPVRPLLDGAAAFRVAPYLLLSVPLL